MSTILSFRNGRERKGSSRRTRSEDRSSTRERKHRVPIFEIEKGSDVCTKICSLMGETILKNPSINTGVFFETIRESNLAINQSDVVLMVTAAFLAHLGNEKSSMKLLSKSATVTAYYRKMSLEDSSTRALLVTMITAMNPLFAEMIRSTVKIAMERAADENRSMYDEVRLNDAFSMLSKQGSVTNEEMRILGPKVTPITIPSATRYISSTIHPSESASVIADKSPKSPPIRRVTGQKDLMDYIKERRHNRAKSFEETFPSEKQPVRANAMRKKRGIGYEEEEDDMETIIAKTIKNMSFNIDTKGPSFSKLSPSISADSIPRSFRAETSASKTPTRFYGRSPTDSFATPNAETGSIFDVPSLSSENMLNYSTSEMKRAHIGMSNGSFAGSLEDLI